MINSPIYFVMDDKDRMMGIFSKTDLLRPTKARIILVDHNEVGQAVNGASEVKILEIIDHHRLGNTPTSQPILFINEPVGSSCTIVADQFQRYKITPSPDDAMQVRYKTCRVRLGLALPLVNRHSATSNISI